MKFRKQKENLVIFTFIYLFIIFLSYGFLIMDKKYSNLHEAIKEKPNVFCLELNSCSDYDLIYYDSISKLFNLKYLSISECPQINNLPLNIDCLNLKVFEFYYNSTGLEKYDFSKIGSIDSLESLKLGPYNSIKRLPDSFKNLKHLKILDLQLTDIEEIPKWISEMKSLEEINLSMCNLISIPVNELNKLTNLKTIKIYESKMTNNEKYIRYLKKKLKCEILF
jgi:Leucine-rich repeat (LRR) protein